MLVILNDTGLYVGYVQPFLERLRPSPPLAIINKWTRGESNPRPLSVHRKLYMRIRFKSGNWGVKFDDLPPIRFLTVYGQIPS